MSPSVFVYTEHDDCRGVDVDVDVHTVVVLAAPKEDRRRRRTHSRGAGGAQGRQATVYATRARRRHDQRRLRLLHDRHTARRGGDGPGVCLEGQWRPWRWGQRSVWSSVPCEYCWLATLTVWCWLLYGVISQQCWPSLYVLIQKKFYHC